MRAIVKWTPFHDFDLIERRMRQPLDTVGIASPPLPAVDVFETDDELVIELEAPGFTKDELAVQVFDHTLTVKGERSATRDEEEKTFRLHERVEREFERRFALPADADSAHLKAHFEHGVIEIRAPKAKSAKPRSVTIDT